MAELLSVPLKKSSDVDIVKPLKNLIQSTYDSTKSTEDYTEALNELSRMRTNAIWKVFEKSSLDFINCYYDQLVSLETKIPPQEVQIPFKWKDAFDKGSLFGGRMSLTISSLAYERVCVMFNMAAMQSVLAAQQPLDTEDSLKLAAKLLQQAAGIFAHLKANVMLAVHQETTPDLAPETLGALSQLMLAQAQEVIAYKCIKDEMKDSMVAKVCAQCEELYTEALRAISKDSLRPLWDRDWIPTVTAKQSAFRGFAQYYQSAVCRDKRAVGEEIARLQLAAEALKAAQARLAGAALLGEGAARAARALAAALRDNDFIYHERVPEPRALDPIGRAPVAQPLPPPHRAAPAHPDLLSSLLPLGVRAAQAALVARLAEAGGACVAQLREGSRLLAAALAALGLPARLEAAGGGGAQLPASVRDRAATLRASGGLPALQRLVADMPDLLQRNKDILDEAERMLREEEEADSALRAQFGAQWARTPSARLTEAFRANAAKYRQIIDNAVRADHIVQQKFNQHRDAISLLCGSEGELCAGVPQAEAGAGADDGGVLASLRALMADVDRLRAERDQLEAELKEAATQLRPHLMDALQQHTPPDEAAQAAAVGAAMAPLQRRVQESLSRQEEVLGRVQAAAGGLAPAGGSDREQALARLAAAYDAYQELSGNLQEGTKFYNDLTQLLVAFQNKVSDFCFARKTEKDELLKDLTQQAARAPPEPPVERREAPARPAPPTPAPPPASAPTPAAGASSSLPYPAQPQGMPVPYGGAAYPYYVAPMPAVYNPYATLPYPHHARLPQPYQQPYQPYQPPPQGYNPYGPPQ